MGFDRGRRGIVTIKHLYRRHFVFGQHQSAIPVIEFDASRSHFAYAWQDLQQAVSNPRLIITIVANDFLTRYHGSALGGLWVTFTTLATVAGLSILYSKIFGVDIKIYLPYVGVGIIIWGVISSLVNEGTSVFTSASGIFNQTPIPKSLFAFKVLGRSLINLFYKLMVLIGVLALSGTHPGFLNIFISLAGLVLLFWTGFWGALALGTIGARFRDMGQFAATLLTFSFFMTPVFWQPNRLGEYEFIIHYNPLYHYINAIRGPLIGAHDVATSFAWVIGCSAVATAIGMLVYGYFARRLSYWC